MKVVSGDCVWRAVLQPEEERAVTGGGEGKESRQTKTAEGKRAGGLPQDPGDHPQTSRIFLVCCAHHQSPKSYLHTSPHSAATLFFPVSFSFCF